MSAGYRHGREGMMPDEFMARHRVVVEIEITSDDGPPDRTFWTDYLMAVLADDEVTSIRVTFPDGESPR